jgi:hypothetical protein
LRFLISNPTLEKVTLGGCCYNSIHGGILNGLEGNLPHLKKFKCRDDEANDSVMLRFLETHPKLRTLEVYPCSYSDVSILALTRLHGLKKLIMRLNPSSSQGNNERLLLLLSDHPNLKTLKLSGRVSLQGSFLEPGAWKELKYLRLKNIEGFGGSFLQTFNNSRPKHNQLLFRTIQKNTCRICS